MNYINSLSYFDVNNKDFISEYDKELFLKHIKSEEYYRLANLELTLAHRVSDFSIKIVKQSKE